MHSRPHPAGIICVEDLIHEIYTVGPAFKQANNFLWPFKLSSAKVGCWGVACGWVRACGCGVGGWGLQTGCKQLRLILKLPPAEVGLLVGLCCCLLGLPWVLW